MVPALLEMNSWQRGDFLPGKTASPALSKELFMFGQRRIGSGGCTDASLKFDKALDHDDEVFDPPQGTTASLELHKAVICMLAYQCGRNTNGYDAADPH
ncbi:Hypothetical predicted protein [Scomber scombrus]|uniref:Uncharacterized protein n=1 Tax=Scomber scombrus TaxID=13677 RepID=A0AAV1NAJ5_SCOSC